ncbi:MAG: bifunctional phosphoribosylaminoimidazolecarboxamide formyltransferase/IMP cyclohydrolase [Saprospiraceae bacterium]|nr:bifunctional phosphoribosylaminoimidazolecarboxamide formyltransferase/IMP cyclohydrolase [Saprospiraceae bacterium]
MKRALISVFYKTNVDVFAQFLVDKGYEIISTGGTKRFLEAAGITVIDISEVTNFPEMLDGRVKTLHPKIHGGLLGIRSNEAHVSTMKAHQIDPIDMVVVNLYPFFTKLHEDLTFEEKVEFIDIGGPTMLRSAAKNYKDVAVVSDYKDYDDVMAEMSEHGEVTEATKRQLAAKVFNLTSAYDAAISEFMFGQDERFPTYLNASYKKMMDLRYGENPHQDGAFYASLTATGAMKDFDQLHGKALSFNNIRDMDVAWKVVSEFDELTCCGLKHSTPCGVAQGATPAEAYTKAYECDPISIFGGIVALNREVDAAAATEMKKIFLEIIIAPSFSEEAIEILSAKKNLRLIQANQQPADQFDFVKVDGGLLVQEADLSFSNDFKVVTKRQPTEDEMANLLFAMKVVKHVKSNAIVVAKDKMANGIGTGETNRIWAARQATTRAGDAWVLASDAFFPFDDVVQLCAEEKITAIIQPGGSIRDEDSIKACDDHGIAMVFTGMRHFKH